MPIMLLVRAEDSPTFPAPGSWQKGDIINVRGPADVDNPWGNLETLPKFVRIRITNVNTPDLGWLAPGPDGETVNRRSARVAPEEIDAIIAANPEPIGNVGAHASYTRAQFNSRVVTK